MFLRHTRADKRQDSSNFRLRKPKKSHVQSSNISSYNDNIINTNFHSNISTSVSLAAQKPTDENSNNNFSVDDFLNDDFSINNNIFHDNFDKFSNEQEIDINEQEYNIDTSSEFSESDEQEYDGRKKKYYYSGNTGPYFPNFTTFLLFLWITKHQIST